MGYIRGGLYSFGLGSQGFAGAIYSAHPGIANGILDAYVEKSQGHSANYLGAICQFECDNECVHPPRGTRRFIIRALLGLILLVYLLLWHLCSFNTYVTFDS